jgi:hypothetical protein
MKKFKLVDLYEEDWDVIGYADTKEEMNKIINDRIDDTDGECSIYYLPLNPLTNKYSRGKAVFIESINSVKI